MKIVIIYHNGYGHTKIVAEHIQKGASREWEQLTLLSTLEAQDNLELLHRTYISFWQSNLYGGNFNRF